MTHKPTVPATSPVLDLPDRTLRSVDARLSAFEAAKALASVKSVAEQLAEFR
jgi:hypothetical protein